MKKIHLPSAGSGRRRTTGFAAVLALALGGLVAVASPASADSGSIPIALHGTGSLGSETASASSGAISGSITASASLAWDQASVVSADWVPDKVRQGRDLDPTDQYSRTAPGHLSITYSVSASASLDASSVGAGTLSIGFGPVSITADGTCDLKTSGADYTCHLESGSVSLIDPTPAGLFLPYVDGKMVADVTVSPDQLSTLRTASAAGQVLGTHNLQLGEDPVVDPLLVGCKTGTGDHLIYALGDASSTPALHIVSGIEIEAGVVLPNPVTAVPGIYTEVYSHTFPVATTDMPVTLGGAGGSIDMGAIQANNIAPTLGAVSAPDGVEGTPIQFSTSATGPCAAGATYRWDFGDGSGPGHTASPQHTYADNGYYTGQVVVTDTTGLTDTQDFALTVSNVDPNVTVIPGAPVTVPWGKALTLKAQAVDPGAADQSTLTYDWAFGDGDSIDNGGTSATHSWAAVGDPSPSVNVCDKDGGCTPKDFVVHVRKRDTTLSYTGPQASTYTGNSTLTATLVDEFGNAVNNAPVVFSVDGNPVGTATTSASGVASLSYAAPASLLAGNHTVAADSAASPLYTAAVSGSQPFVVSEMPTTLTYTGGLVGAPNKAVTVSAKLVDALNRPLSGQTVTFQIGTQSKQAVTNSSGVASTTITLNQKPGYYSLTASFARVVGQYQGDDDTRQFSLNKK
jgi:PKD repeat protein